MVGVLDAVGDVLVASLARQRLRLGNRTRGYIAGVTGHESAEARQLAFQAPLAAAQAQAALKRKPAGQVLRQRVAQPIAIRLAGDFAIESPLNRLELQPKQAATALPGALSIPVLGSVLQ